MGILILIDSSMLTLIWLGPFQFDGQLVNLVNLVNLVWLTGPLKLGQGMSSRAGQSVLQSGPVQSI